jgi:putative transposase
VSSAPTRAADNLPGARGELSDVLRPEEEVLRVGFGRIAQLRQLREENSKLKRLVADLSLDRHMLQEIVQKKL